jgi:hypothetical protein
MPLPLLATLALALEDPQLGIQDTKVVDAALFKNGYCVVTSEATIPPSGELLVEAPRSAVLGTFWLRAADGKVMTAVNGYVQREVLRDPGTIDEYLQASIGKSVVLELPKGEVTGVLENFNGTIAALRVGNQLLVLNRGQIVSVRVSGDAKSFRTAVKVPVPVLKVTGLRGTRVQFSMMQQGIWWSPAYNVDITDPTNLKLTARAVIINDLVDLKDQDLRLVTGFPNLPFLNQLDPITMGASVGAVVGQFGGFGGGAAAPAMQMQFANREASASDRAGFAGIDMDSMQGFSAEDLFMYPQKGVTLNRGERMYRQLFQATSAYEHVHTLDVPMLSDANGNRAGGDGPLDIWHEIKFTNKANLPLTTGPATVMKGNDIVGQDTLTYTSKDQDTRVKISKALDLSARQQEEEKSRERGFILDRYKNPRFDRLTVLGKIEIRNRKSSEVKLEVKKALFGDVVEAGGGTVVKEPTSMWEVNSVSRVKWNLSLKPGESRVLEYTYTVLRTPA